MKWWMCRRVNLPSDSSNTAKINPSLIPQPSSAYNAVQNSQERNPIMSTKLLVAALMTCMFACGCSTTPRTDAKKDALDADAQAAIANMKADDPSFDSFLKTSYGYVIFPSVGKG